MSFKTTNRKSSQMSYGSVYSGFRLRGGGGGGANDKRQNLTEGKISDICI